MHNSCREFQDNTRNAKTKIGCHKYYKHDLEWKLVYIFINEFLSMQISNFIREPEEDRKSSVTPADAKEDFDYVYLFTY